MKTILEEVLERNERERAALLTEACGDDAELRAELESLLRYHNAADKLSGAAGALALNSASTLFSAPTEQAEFAGRQFGHYQLIRELGKGGMGAVYLAARADDYRQQVALKLIRRGMDTEFVLERFLNERQILAALNHPNIARLLDGGATEDGSPYLVMEYIEGLPIDEYCRRRQPSLKERLQLFRQVCSAVQFAHQHLVIHRDLKPSNILVTSDGLPKLLDFGIAKLLTPELASQTLNPTAPEFRLMTPAYASPEQVKGELITTASDVYALGVILYELLTGRSPYQQPSGQLHEMMRAVCEEQPEKPSTAVTRKVRVETASANTLQTGGAPPASQPRTVKTEKLRRSLKGDLDNIVLMALRKEPVRRYASVEQFSEDIRRHLEGLPVSARKDTLAYRSTKFVQRNKLGVAAAALTLLTLIGGSIATAWQAHVARSERARAEQRFNQVRKLAHSIMFDYHDEIAALPGSTKVRERLVKDSLEYLDNLAKEAGNDRSLQLELALAYQRVGDVKGKVRAPNLGDTAGALTSFRKAQTILSALSAADPANLDVRRKLATADVSIGDMLAKSYESAVALQSFRQAQTISEEVYAADPTNAETRSILWGIYVRGTGDWLRETGDVAGALESYHKALALAEAMVTANPKSVEVRRFVQISYGRIGDALGNPNFPSQGNIASALDYWRKALMVSQALSAEAPTNVRVRRDLYFSHARIGDILAYQGDTAGAMEYYRKAATIVEEMVTADPADVTARSDLAFCYRKIGQTQTKMGATAEALKSFRQALVIDQALAAADSGDAANRRSLGFDYQGIGDALNAMGNPAGAIENYRETIAIFEKLPDSGPANIQARSELAEADFKLASAKAKLASNLKLSPARRQESLVDAYRWYQRSLDLWQETRRRGKLNNADVGKPDAVVREMAKCAAALAKLR